MPRKIKDITGNRFGRLVVLSRAENSKTGKPMWNCHCDCGNDCVISGSALVAGNTKSCGCYRREWAASTGVKHRGCTRNNRDRLYGVWNMMKQRCNDPNCKAYKDYGGRGITVCKEWDADYGAFREWAINNGYDENAKSHECTIDRIDNGKGYSPENCRFVGAKEQARNTRNSRYITCFGETKTLAEWSEQTGIYYLTIHYRLKSGWSVEDALTLKAGEKKRCKTKS